MFPFKLEETYLHKAISPQNNERFAQGNSPQNNER